MLSNPDVKQPVLGAIVNPQDIPTEQKGPSFRDFPGRTKGLIGTLVFWSMFVLSLFRIVFIIYPIMSGAIEYGFVLRPQFDSIEQADYFLKVASIIGQWNIPVQLIHFLFGPSISLLAGESWC